MANWATAPLALRFPMVPTPITTTHTNTTSSI